MKKMDCCLVLFIEYDERCNTYWNNNSSSEEFCRFIIEIGTIDTHRQQWAMEGVEVANVEKFSLFIYPIDRYPCDGIEPKDK